MAIRKRSGLLIDEPTDLSRGANDDKFASDIRRRGEKITRIVDIYDGKDAWSVAHPPLDK